jgi:hypothetical protein
MGVIAAEDLRLVDEGIENDCKVGYFDGCSRLDCGNNRRAHTGINGQAYVKKNVRLVGLKEQQLAGELVVTLANRLSDLMVL